MAQCIFFVAVISTRINIVNRIIRTVGIQVEPVAPVGVLLRKPANDRVIEPGSQIILLSDGIDLLAVVGEAVGDGLLLDLNLSPCVILVAVLNIAVFINDMGR